jgi:hypothetical protein
MKNRALGIGTVKILGDYGIKPPFWEFIFGTIFCFFLVRGVMVRFWLRGIGNVKWVMKRVIVVTREKKIIRFVYLTFWLRVVGIEN